MEYEKKKIIASIVIGLVMGITAIAMRHYSANNYTFICNDNVCEVTLINAENKVISKKKINKYNIDHFESELKFGPKESRHHTIGPNYWESGKVYYIYVVPKKGKRFRLSFFYYPNINYNDKVYVKDLIDTLNNALKGEPLNINYSYR